METKTKTTRKPKPDLQCKCCAVDSGRRYSIGGEETDEPIYGLCGHTTKRTFAPGHDAKLKSVLIQCHLKGIEYHYGDSISADPMVVADTFGWGHFLRDAKTRADAKPTKRARTPKPEIVEVKIGRWTYPVVEQAPAKDGLVSILYVKRDGTRWQDNVKPEQLLVQS